MLKNWEFNHFFYWKLPFHGEKERKDEGEYKVRERESAEEWKNFLTKNAQ